MNATQPTPRPSRDAGKKRGRKRSKHTDDVSAPLQLPCAIGRLPLEILAEILSYTTPRDILALARTSKYFCNTLVGNGATLFIWKKARMTFHPPIPEPTPNFTEVSYAAFLFDGSECEVSNS